MSYHLGTTTDEAINEIKTQTPPAPAASSSVVPIIVVAALGAGVLYFVTKRKRASK